MKTDRIISAAHAAIWHALAREIERHSRELGSVESWLEASREALAHAGRTSNYVRMLASAAQDIDGIAELEPKCLSFGAAFHDIGKLCLPSQLLLAPRSLSAEEYRIVRTHTLGGKKIIEIAQREAGSENPALRCALQMASCHHERWDGTGYPFGLKGEAIPVAARIMAIADSYDAIVSPRAYKPAIDTARAIEMLLAGAGSAYDPVLVQRFVDSMTTRAQRSTACSCECQPANQRVSSVCCRAKAA